MYTHNIYQYIEELYITHGSIHGVYDIDFVEYVYAIYKPAVTIRIYMIGHLLYCFQSQVLEAILLSHE